jgi:hypothetical protein
MPSAATTFVAQIAYFVVVLVSLHRARLSQWDLDKLWLGDAALADG